VADVPLPERRVSGYLGEFEQLILFSVLELGDDAYGVTIRENIEARTSRLASIGAIYTALGRLEDRGLVASRTESPRGRPGRPRKFYTLRREGAEALRASYATLQSAAKGLVGKVNELAEG